MGTFTHETDGSVVSAESLRLWELPTLPDGSEHKMDVRLVTYFSQGLKVKAYLVKPVSEENRLWPGLVYCRGGIGRVGMVRLPRMMELAERGYAVMAPVYRGNLGGEGREDFGGDDLYDLIHAIRALRSFSFIERKRFPLIGFSRGAIMALLAAAECPDVGPVAVWGGVSDLLLTYEERVDLRRMLRRVVGHPKKQEERYRRRSPRLSADRIDNPVLIIHGSEDRQVGVKHAHSLAEALEKAGKTYSMRLYDGLGHVFPKQYDKDALDAIFAWFGKHEATLLPDNGGVTNG